VCCEFLVIPENWEESEVVVSRWYCQVPSGTLRACNLFPAGM
jgi:hypothetical protein